jgi:polynucleotide 5'-hydroxyl-kinase GRC3/NOL9
LQRSDAIMFIREMSQNELDQVPAQWGRLDVSNFNGILMVVGAMDTGKTTFVKYLVNQFNQKYPEIACIDGDPGQSRLGPPSTITLNVYKREDPSGTPAYVRRRFIGSVSPSGHQLQVLTGSFRLLDKACATGANVVIFDTSGWIDMSSGGAYLKLSKIDLMRPKTLFVLQRNAELESWLLPLRKSSRVNILDMACIPEKFRRNVDIRRSCRIDGFKRYFAHAHVIEVDFSNFAVFPSVAFTVHQLVSFEDKDGFTSSLGIILSADSYMQRFKIYSPISENNMRAVEAITMGDLILDPQTFRHHIRERTSSQNILSFMRRLWGGPACYQ